MVMVCHRIIGAALLALLVAVAAGGPALAAKPMVAVSIAPQAFFVEQLAGDAVDVLVVAPPGASPATYDPTPRQVGRLADAALYLTIGVPFEARFLPKLRSAAPGLKVADMAQGVTRRAMDEDEDMTPAREGQDHTDHDHHHGGKDPHVWLSPRLAQTLAANTAARLAELLPGQAGAINARLAALQGRLTGLDQRLAARLAPFNGQVLLVFHPAFGYFAHDYGLRQVAIETGGKSPGPRRLARLMDQAKQLGVKVIFVQPQFDTRSAQALAQGIGGVVLPMDPLARDYVANLERMAERVAQALGR